MPHQRNIETQESLKAEIKAIQSRCIDTCNIIVNSPLDTQCINSDNITEKQMCYIEGLRADIENSNTLMRTDDNLITSQFLMEMKEKTTQVDELIAYTRGSIHDVEKEINRLNDLIKTSQEAKSRPRAKKQDVRPDHVQKAKERFQMMKSELHGLIQSLFPSNSDMITDILGELMMQKLNETSSGYIAITSENYQLIELLKDINLVTQNPYNNMEVKLAY